MMASPAQAITNGEPDNGRHPYVGLAVFDDANGPSHRCSASLLSPTVVLTAGHCTPVWAGLRVRLMAPARLVSGSFTHSEEFVRVTASSGQGGGTCCRSWTEMRGPVGP
jgi:trypsin